jgi:hypothetical protein
MGPAMPTSNPMSDPYATSVPHLKPTGSNWAIFSMRFQEAMEANQKWGHFDGSATRPVPTDDKNPTDDKTKAASKCVTDRKGPPSERTPEEKLWDWKTRAQQYARDRRSCDDTRISYLEFLETEAEDDLALARMIAG